MLLDSFIPVYDFEVHAISVRAAPDRIFHAIKEVTPAEVPLLRTLFGFRSLPTRLTGKGALGFIGSQSLLEQMLSAGFVLLAEKTDCEIVLGTIGQFWKLSVIRLITSAEEFLAFDLRGYAKAAINFYVDWGHGNDGVKVSTETRVYAPDPITRKKFAAYWRLIYPGSALLRRMMLRAIKRRAEQA